jgi:hypothetical protein
VRPLTRLTLAVHLIYSTELAPSSKVKISLVHGMTSHLLLGFACDSRGLARSNVRGRRDAAGPNLIRKPFCFDGYSLRRFVVVRVTSYCTALMTSVKVEWRKQAVRRTAQSHLDFISFPPQPSRFPDCKKQSQGRVCIGHGYLSTRANNLGLDGQSGRYCS